MGREGRSTRLRGGDINSQSRLMIVLLSASLAAWAAADLSAAPQKPDGKPAEKERNGIYADLGLFVVGVGYERVLGTHLAVEASAHYYTPWLIDPDVSGYGGQLRTSWFLVGDAPWGWYAAVFFRGERVRDAYGHRGTARSGGGVLGYAFHVFGRYNFRLGLGAQQLRYELDHRPPVVRSPFPTVDIEIGRPF